MLKAVIFDLDNCVFDTKSMKDDFFSFLIKKMKEVDKKFSTDAVVSRIKTSLWYLNLDDVIDMYHIPQHISDVMKEIFSKIEAPSCSKVYDDVKFLKAINLSKILVTSGFFNLQSSKIQVTGIDNIFDEILINCIDDPGTSSDKTAVFRDVLKRNSWLGEEVLVIGDNAQAELRIGKEIGAVTVQTLRPGVFKVPGFDYYIKGFSEINNILLELEALQN